MLACIYVGPPTRGAETVSGTIHDTAFVTGAESWVTELLRVVPRVRVDDGLVWADVRGMPLAATVEALARLVAEVRVPDALPARVATRELAHSADNIVRAIGLACVPSVAAVAAREQQSGNIRRPTYDPETRVTHRAYGSVHVTYVPPGAERAFLAPYLVDVLRPAPRLANLLDGAGVEYCRDLARLTRESVEVRFGAPGAQLWRAARGDDGRLVFDPMPRARPEASLEWTDYVVKRAERLVFIINALCERVCGALAETGEGASQLTLHFALANRTVFPHVLRAARPTASQPVWMRLVRTALEQLVLPDAVTGITLRIDLIGPLGGKQGDLFDHGFATARAAELAIAQVLDDRSTAVISPANSAHPRLDRRTTWHTHASAHALAHFHEAARAQAAAGPTLSLQLLPRPIRISVGTTCLRGDTIPTSYRDGARTHILRDVAGPDRVSGDAWAEVYAREYFRCVTEDGRLVWLFRDVRADAWYLHGWWD